MPEKKNQHLVPACYLRNFEANVSEIQKTNPKFSSGIYVNNKKLSSEWKLKSVKHKSLTKAYFYNLPEDDLKQPLIENYLSVVEGDYVKYFKEIAQEIVSCENISFMSFFVTLQFMRVEAFIETFQGAWDKITEWMDDFEGTDNYKTALKDISKRQLVDIDIGNLIHSHSAIIYNRTNFPFITSDNPVVRREINITDALKIIPKRYLLEIEDESIEFTCFFLPLSPIIAYVSCELIKSHENIIYSNSDFQDIFFLNYFSIINSYEKVYSSLIEPIKGENLLSEHLAARSGTIVKIYTQSKRIVCNGTIESNTNFVVSLKLNDPEQVQLIKNCEYIKLLEVVEEGVSIRGMRECKISSIDYVNERVIIESNLQFGI